MNDDEKTKEQLIQELVQQRHRIAELEKIEAARKRAEEALRESEEKYRLVVEHANEAIVVAQDNLLKLVNPKTVELTGYSELELISLPFVELILPEDRELVLERHRKRLRGDELLPHIYPFRIVRRDGTIRWVEINAVVITWEGRAATLNFLTDITERQKADEELEKRRQELNGPVKELNCLYGLSKLVEKRDLSLDAILQGCVELIPPASLYPAITCARIVVEGKEFRSKNFKATPWKLSSTLRLRNEPIGAVEVYYLEEQPELDKGPFLQEERMLFDAVTERLGRIIERKRAENALRESENKYKTLAENIPQKIFIKDINSVYISCNENYARDLKIKSNEIVGKTDYDFHSRELADKYRADDKRVIESGKEEELEEKYISDGREVWVNTIKTPVKDENENVIGVLGIFWDITDRKLAADKIRESEERLKSIVENSSDQIFMLDKDCKFLSINKTAADISKKSSQELIGTSIFAIFPESTAVKFSRNIKDVFDTGKSLLIEEKMLVQGRELYNSSSLNPVKDGKGSVIAVTGIVRDITDRKRTEDALLESEEKFRTFVDTASDLMLISDKDENITDVNQSLTRTLRYSKEELIGMHITQLLSKESLEKDFKLNWEKYVKNGEISLDITLATKDGEDIHAELKAIAVYDHDGKYTGSRAVFHDLTERKQAEDARERLLNELKAKNRELERFTYTVSHDLRSPLVTIQGFTSMLQNDLERDNKEKAETDLQYITKATSKMDELLSATLELSRIGRIANPPEDVPFGTIVEGALEQTSGELHANSIEVSVAKDFPVVHVDRTKLEEVLVNLVGNSIKYRGDQPHPKIGIGHRREGAETVFFVKDNGIGIAKSEQDKVFDLFYRVDKSTEGTGAGLAIVKRIVEVHGGRIWIESEKGKGCTVCFTLPVV